MSDVLLEVEGLAIRYGALPAVNWASFKLERNRVLGIVGESGSGKSTLIWALTRLLPDVATISSGRSATMLLRVLRISRLSSIAVGPGGPARAQAGEHAVQHRSRAEIGPISLTIYPVGVRWTPTGPGAAMCDGVDAPPKGG